LKTTAGGVLRKMQKDRNILRDLAKQTMEVAVQDIQNERRKLWADFHSMKTRQTPVYILDPQGIWNEIFGDSALECEDPLFRHYEKWLRLQLYHASFGDDYILEPWVTAGPVYKKDDTHWETWGYEYDMEYISATQASAVKEAPIKSPDDLNKFIAGVGVVDEEATKRRLNMLRDVMGDIIPVLPDMMPPKISDLSYILFNLLGGEEMMMWMYDDPDMMHELCRKISEASIAICDAADASGKFTNNDGIFGGNPLIQAMPYSHELPNPGEQITVSAKERWLYDRAQEFEGVSPEMFNEFIIEYQKPLYERFGLISFGCCEGLTKKIKYLKKIDNLRRIAVTPWADTEECARQIEDKYIVSWRPHPTEMIAHDFNPERIKQIIREAKTIFDRYGCYWEVNLKDFITVGGDKDRLQKWVTVVRETL